MVHPAPSVSAPLAWPPFSSSTYTLADPWSNRVAGSLTDLVFLRRQQRTSWDLTGKFTNHCSEVNPPSTLTLDRWLTVSATDRRSFEVESPCFTDSWGLALRRGRNVNPPRTLFPGSFATTVKVTLAAYLHKMKFEKQFPDRYGPARVGSGRHGDLTVYCESSFDAPRLSS
jgi:hypothetical protein